MQKIPRSFLAIFIVAIFTLYQVFISDGTGQGPSFAIKTSSEKDIKSETEETTLKTMSSSAVTPKFPMQRSDSKRTILFWNSYWEWTHFQMGAGNRGFKECSGYSNCYTTTRRSKLRDPNEIIDAIVFHGVRLKLNEIAQLKRRRKYIAKVNQGVDPYFVLFVLESPTGANLTDPVFNDFFNITFTYRSSADIARPYGAFVHKDTKELVDQFQDPKVVKTRTLSDFGLPDFSSRSKGAAWIVSHCQTDSHREDYVKSLKKHFENVDIYGECGNLSVPNKPDVDAGYIQLATEYKFYISFENSLCNEYITEKFFNAFKYGMLPVVNGGMSKEDYLKVAPKHSFLHINDFKSPQHLSEMLIKLSRNESLFNSYFWWHDYYEIQTDFLHQTNCQLCDKINEENFKSTNDYSNFKDYWHQCVSE